MKENKMDYVMAYNLLKEELKIENNPINKFLKGLQLWQETIKNKT